MRRIGIIQPNYIPWRGYFDFIHEVDTFVYLDDVQYTVRDWRNRNRVKLKSGDSVWLTVPVLGGRSQLINEVRIDHRNNWAGKQLALLQQNYGKTPFFKDYASGLEDVLQSGLEFLVDLDIELTRRISDWLGITTEFVRASELGCEGVKDERLIQIVGKLGGDTYLSGPAAKAYLQPQLWAEANLSLEFKDYSGYPEYRQISEPFEPSVSVLDLLFMTGPSAPDYIWGAKREKTGQD